MTQDAVPPSGLSAHPEASPWMGLAAYPEEARALFFGRDRETSELLRLVKRETLTVLFGQSGLGKSSLLHAGLFPQLRQEDFLPVYLRIDYGEESPEPVLQVQAAIARCLERHAVDAPGPTGRQGLWEYFHHRDTEFWSVRNRLLTVVLVLDQFEELYTLGRANAERISKGQRLVAQLAQLVENRPPEELSARLERDADLAQEFSFEARNCKVLLSLREDYLAHLEGLRGQLRTIVLNRFRLTQMTGVQALAAVTGPGGDLISPEAARQVVGFVAGAQGAGPTEAALNDLTVEPALLSVVCRELDGRRRQRGEAQISVDLLGGTTSEILDDFYARSMADLPAAVRVCVEERLLTLAGYREMVALEDVLAVAGVTRESIDRLVDRRLLRLEDHFGIPRLELTHDVLTGVVRASRDARREGEQVAQEKEQARQLRRKLRRTRWMVAASAVTILVMLVMLLAVGVFWAQMHFTGELYDLQAGHAANRSADWGTAMLHLYETPLKSSFRNWPRTWPSAWFSARYSMTYLVPELGLLSYWFGEGVAFSPDGRLVATGSESGIVQIWHARTGKELRMLVGPERAVYSVAFSPDSRLLASTSADSIVRLWDVASGDLLRTLGRHGGGTYGIAFSPDGRLLASSSSDSTVSLWDVANGVLRLVLRGHGDSVLGVAFSPNGHLLASASADHTIRLWDTDAGNTQLVLSGHGKGVNAVAFSPDGRYLASASDDRTVLVWDVLTGSHRSPVAEYQEAATAVSFSPDGQLLASGSWDRTVQLWNVASDERRALLRAGGLWDVNALAFSPDGRTLAAASGSLMMWHIPTSEPLVALSGHTDSICAVAFSPDGRLLASASADCTIRLWGDAGAGAPQTLTGHRSAVLLLAFSPDGRLLASSARDGELRLWDADTGQPVTTLATDAVGVSSLAFSPDGHLLLVSCTDAKARIWDAAAGTEVTGTLLPGDAATESVAISPNGLVLASGTATHEVRLSDLPSGTEGAVLRGHTARITHLTFSGDGELLASSSADNFVCLWDVANGTALPNGLGWRAGVIQPVSMAFNPGTDFGSLGLHLATTYGSNSIRVLAMDDGVFERQLLMAHGDQVVSLVFNPSFRGAIFASGSRDGTVRLWPVDNNYPLALHSGYEPTAANLAFSPDGETLAFGAKDHTVRLWTVGPQGGSPFYEQMEEVYLRGLSYWQGGYHDNEPINHDLVLVARARSSADPRWQEPWLPDGSPHDTSFSENLYGASWVLADVVGYESDEYADVLRDLLSRGADVDQWLLLHGDETMWRLPLTPLMIASLRGVSSAVEILLEHGAQVDLRDSTGATALTHVGRSGHADVARALLKAGADPSTRDAVGATPLMYAAGAGHLEVVELLLENGARAGDNDNAGQSALDMARANGSQEIMQLLERAVAKASE